jgi:hypothetical protein
MSNDHPFRILPDAEFYALTTAQKADYLKAAVEAQKRLTQQMVDAMRESLRNYPDSQDKP